MAVKWIGMGLLFLLCNGCGVWMAARYEVRVGLLTGMKEMVADMRAAMGALRYTPGQWLAHYQRRSVHPFIAELVEILLEETKMNPSDSLEELWRRSVGRCLSRSAYASALTEEDAETLRRVGGGLGAGDAATLTDHLNYAGELIERQRAEAAEQCRRKKGMYMRMGFLTGLGVVIILL